MSKENLKEFLEKVKEDEKLQDEIEKLKAEDEKSAREIIVEVARKRGYEIEEGDFKEEKELSEDDLEEVAGGTKPGHNNMGKEDWEVIWNDIKNFFGF